jgi:DNA segregation ATPase FtsK/SpoIIIE-like protein
MNARYERLLTQGKRRISRGDGMCLHLVAMDEMALYLSDEDRKARAELFGLLRDLVARGRAAGIIFVGATQKPSGDVVPTALRDLVAIRWALRCSTRDASDTILGAGWATKGVSAASIGLDQRGVGYLLAEGALPVRLRSYYLSDEDLASLAERARRVRDAWAKEHRGEGRGLNLAVVA